MIKKNWLVVPVAALALLGAGLPTMTANMNAGVHASATYHSNFDNIMSKRITFGNYKQSFNIHGRVTPVQLNRYLRDEGVNIDKASSLVYENGVTMDLIRDTVRKPLWQYSTLETNSASGKNVKSGSNTANNNKEVWLDGNMSPSRSVHMRTPMKQGYYYLSNNETSSSADFMYHGTKVGVSPFSFGFDVPNTPDSHYHGTMNQFRANLRKYGANAPKGYRIASNNPYSVHMADYQYNHNFPDPEIQVVKDNVVAPVEYIEGSSLVSAGSITNPSNGNLGSQVKGASLTAPTNGYKVDGSPALKSANGQPYVVIPTALPAKPKQPAPQPKPDKTAPIVYNEGGTLVGAGASANNVTPTNYMNKVNGAQLTPPTGNYTVVSNMQPSLKVDGNGQEYIVIPTKAPAPQVAKVSKKVPLHWIKTVKSCQLYRHMSRNGRMYSSAMVVHPTPGYNNSFYVEKYIPFRHSSGRYLVRYHNHSYYITSRSDFIQNCYYQRVPADHRVKVILPCIEYTQSRYNRQTKVRDIHGGTKLTVVGIKKIGREEQMRFRMRNGHYVTANRNYVTTHMHARVQKY